MMTVMLEGDIIAVTGMCTRSQFRCWDLKESLLNFLCKNRGDREEGDINKQGVHGSVREVLE